MTWFLMALPRSRAASNSGKAETAAARLRSALPVVRSMASFSVRSARAASARALKDCCETIMSGLLADGGAVGEARQHFDRVEAAGPGAPAVQLARHVHQAAEIARQQKVRARALDRLGLLADDPVRDRRIFHAEGAAEAAADIVPLQRAHLKPLDMGEQRTRLFRHAQIPQARAAVVIGGGGIQPPPFGYIPHDIDKEAGDLMGLCRDGGGASGPVRVAREEVRIAVPDRRRAGARRQHGVIIGLQRRHGLACQPCRIGVVAAVEGGLAAARLLPRHLDHATGLFQKLDGGEADPGADRIDEAGDEKTYPRNWLSGHDDLTSREQRRC